MAKVTIIITSDDGERSHTEVVEVPEDLLTTPEFPDWQQDRYTHRVAQAFAQAYILMFQERRDEGR